MTGFGVAEGKVKIFSVSLPEVVYCSWSLQAGDGSWDKALSWGKVVRGDLCNPLEIREVEGGRRKRGRETPVGGLLRSLE